MRFAGKRAVVTGGMSGIGEAVAKRIAAEGGKVAIWDVTGGIKTDISDYASVEAALAETVKRIGGVDILVNSAGITGPTVPVNGFPIDGWMKTMAINVNGCFFTNRAVVPLMIAQNYGRIVNIASIAGKEGNPNASAYSASKAAVIGFTIIGQGIGENQYHGQCRDTRRRAHTHLRPDATGTYRLHVIENSKGTVWDCGGKCEFDLLVGQ
jgi:2-dehydro-3-deoxy-L-rhamnonate dehydrogenase (NAD+)